MKPQNMIRLLPVTFIISCCKKALFYALAFISLAAGAQTVQDGDSIIRGDGVRVRLYGIDAPERDQP